MDCCEKDKKRKELLNRISRIEGHFKKVKSMVTEDKYCIDIITQSLAIQSALRSLDEAILKNHLETCVKDAFVSNKGVETKITEVIKTIKFMRK